MRIEWIVVGGVYVVVVGGGVYVVVIDVVDSVVTTVSLQLNLINI